MSNVTVFHFHLPSSGTKSRQLSDGVCLIRERWKERDVSVMAQPISTVRRDACPLRVSDAMHLETNRSQSRPDYRIEIVPGSLSFAFRIDYAHVVRLGQSSLNDESSDCGALRSAAVAKDIYGRIACLNFRIPKNGLGSFQIEIIHVCIKMGQLTKLLAGRGREGDVKRNELRLERTRYALISRKADLDSFLFRPGRKGRLGLGARSRLLRA